MVTSPVHMQIKGKGMSLSKCGIHERHNVNEGLGLNVEARGGVAVLIPICNSTVLVLSGHNLLYAAHQ